MCLSKYVLNSEENFSFFIFRSGLSDIRISEGLLYNVSSVQDRSLSNSSRFFIHQHPKSIFHEHVKCHTTQEQPRNTKKKVKHNGGNIHAMGKTYVVLSDSAVGVATDYGPGGEESQFESR
jgi:hypothetical protein